MAFLSGERLMRKLPGARGSLEPDAPLRKLTWFRTGGPAEVLFRPADEDDLCTFLSRLEESIPLTILGLGSNVLVRDGGVQGVVIHLGKPFSEIEIESDRLRAGGGATDFAIARAAADAGLGGLEFLRGIPGMIGGALRMNAGAYGREISDVFVEATAIDRKGERRTLDKAAMDFSYRHSGAPDDLFFISAVLSGTPEEPEDVHRRMEEIAAERENSQPVRTRTGGSTFKNPPPEVSGGRKAWELIAESRCRGLTLGDAQVSEKHANFLINLGDATSADLERLGEEVRHRVEVKTGVRLEWEIRRIGDWQETHGS